MGNLKIYSRQWNDANKRKQDIRPSWFSYEKCFNSLKSEKNVDITVILDGKINNHHFNINHDKIIEINGGSDHNSFLKCLEYIKTQNHKDDDIIYIVEDDYIHIPGWVDVLVNAFNTFDVDYITLYDHPDKYFLPMYQQLQSKILYTNKCHWRTTPSTCNTYAAKWRTFKKHWDTHIKYCLPEYTHDGYDHTKFLDLWNQGSNLISPLPSFSTHCENNFISPLRDWENLL